MREKVRGKQQRRNKKIMVVMSSRRRAMQVLDRVTFSHDTTSVVTNPESLSEGFSKREREI